MIDALVFDVGEPESGRALDVEWPELERAFWVFGAPSPVPAANETTTEEATTRTVPEEGGRAFVGAIPGGMQVRILLDGAWDVVFVDSFDEVAAAGAPCSLVLEVYEEDGETIAWEVGTDAEHPFPFLALPENYAAQEVDFLSGAATIGQVEVVVVDRRQIPGDQASGWMTERLTDGAVPAIADRRCRLLRFISPELGSVVIVDGPAGAPRLHSSYAGYRWVIKDQRESERKIRAFTRTDAWVLPMGLEDGWGRYELAGEEEWLVPPTEPLVGTYRTDSNDGKGRVTFEGYWTDPFDVGLLGNRFPSSGSVSDRAVELAAGVVEKVFVDSENLYADVWRWTWSDFDVLWRAAGSSDPWTVVNTIDTANAANLAQGGTSLPRSVVNYIGPNGERTLPGIDHAEADGVRIFAAYSLMIRGYKDVPTPGNGILQDGDFPTAGQSIEVALRYRGEPTEAIPLHLEYDTDGSPLTVGRLLERLYAGEFSDVDPSTGEFVPTGIRYDALALREMTDPVRAVIEKPIDDLRDWSERLAYAPTGWAPSLDRSLRIAPASQIPPDSFEGFPEVNSLNAAPTPDWNAGEFRINSLTFVYPRYFAAPTSEAAEVVNRLAKREVTFTFRSAGSLQRKEEGVEFDGSLFAAVGASDGASLGDEYAATLAAERRLYVFDRYNYGAQAIQLPVRRTDSALWKAGDWIVVDVPWIPDYVLRRRGALWGGQIMSIEDLNCAWRVVLLEEAVPLERPPES